MRAFSLRTVVLIGFVIVVLAMDVANPGQYSYLWFSILWAVLVICGLLFRMPPQLQLLFVGLSLVAGILATTWQALSGRDLIQWGMILWGVLPVYGDGLKWAWNKVGRRGTSASL